MAVKSGWHLDHKIVTTGEMSFLESSDLRLTRIGYFATDNCEMYSWKRWWFEPPKHYLIVVLNWDLS